MSGMTITSSKEVYDPEMLKELSDRTRHSDGTPSSNFLNPEQVAAYLDKAREDHVKWDKQLIASGQMNADGSWNETKSAEYVFIDH